MGRPRHATGANGKIGRQARQPAELRPADTTLTILDKLTGLTVATLARTTARPMRTVVRREE